MNINSEIVVSFTDATVRSFNQILFEDLNFSVKRGEHWALVGSSGAGKSALLEVIAGKLTVSKGDFTHPLPGEPVKQREDKYLPFTWQHQIGLVASKHHFQNRSHTNDFYYQQRFNSSDSEDTETVDQYLERMKSDACYGAWTYDRVVEKLNLLLLKDKHLIKLSNGETKRLMIASALIRNPVLLLFDNPFTGLDIATRNDLNNLCTEIAASGISIIMATSPNEIPDVITHVAVMEERKITASMEKENFSPGEVKFFTSPIDHKELNQLLSLSQQSQYETIVGMEDVVIRYGKKTILDHVNWQIKQGERWALTGANGAGKSTLLSLVNGDNPQAYANNIILFDRRRGSGESIWDIKKKTGFVSPELFQYFPTDNSCMQVIESGFYDTLGLFRSSDPDKVEIVKRWMKLLEIEQFSTKLIKNVSASIQRLCLLVRALVKNPPLLIFDEPCQGLDAHQQEHFKQIIDAICNCSNTTLIYVSHYQQELPESINHTLKLANGKAVN
ncbi:MAG: ATP-binding cassette domain-containing protein [Bacteroidota bacterium]|nr:ATP-binding cassette domain-containing protein [Bacteroidota bacterium]